MTTPPDETRHMVITYEIRIPNADNFPTADDRDPRHADEFVERAIERIMRKRGKV